MTAKFWIGGTGTWDNTGDTHWSTTSGGSNDTTHPVAADTVTFDGASGGGTVTINANLAMTSLTMGAFTGTIDFSANNNNITLQTMSGTGTGARTLNMGSGTWTVTGTTGTVWDFGTTTNLTFAANSSILNFSATPTGTRTMTTGAGARTYSTIGVTSTGAASQTIGFTLGLTLTIATFNLTGPCVVFFPIGATTTVATVNFSGSAFNATVVLRGASNASTWTLSVASGSPTITWATIYDMIATGGATFNATNSFNMQNNTGITISGPSGGAAAAYVIGS